MMGAFIGCVCINLAIITFYLGKITRILEDLTDNDEEGGE